MLLSNQCHSLVENGMNVQCCIFGNQIIDGNLKIINAGIKSLLIFTDTLGAYLTNLIRQLGNKTRNVISHAEKGYHMLEEWHVNETVKLSALMHHERCDGSGYPHKLKGSQIDRFAKLVTICDIYNAMTSDRSYRKAMSPFDVIEHFEEEGLRKFDTRSILVFLENTVNTYLNCPVRLNNGTVGYVVFINRNRLGRPIIQCGTEFIDLSKRRDLHVVELLPVV